MKRLILDLLRRKAKLLGLAALAQFALGWGQGFYSRHGPDDNPLLVMQIQLGVFLGVFLLALDLQQGLARIVTTLPLTRRQIARAWWLATVAVPGAAFVLLLLAGALAYRMVHSAPPPPGESLLLGSAIIFVMLGASFTFALLTSRAAAADWRRRPLTALGGLFWGLWIGGGVWMADDMASSPLKIIVFLSVGVALTVLGYARAEATIARHTTTLQPIAAEAAATPDRPHRPGGVGGLSQLMRRTFLRGFGLGLLFLFIVPLSLLFTERAGSIRELAEIVFGVSGTLILWMSSLGNFVPVLSHLRLLRTMPLSLSRLAAVLLVLGILPLLALGLVCVSAAALFFDVGLVEIITRNFLSAVIPISVGLTVLVWQGVNMRGYLILTGLLMGTQFVLAWMHFSNSDRTPPALTTAALLAATALLVAYGAIRLTLQRHNRVFQPRPNPFAPPVAARR